jgi:hypothetical protein
MKPEIVLLLNELKQSGKKIREIAKQLKISESLCAYYFNEDKRKDRIKKSVDYFKGLSRERKKKIYDSRKEYLRIYMKKKYNSDPIFKAKQQERARRNKKNIIKG